MNFASGGTEKAPSFKSIDEDSKLVTEIEQRQQEWEKAKSVEVEANEGLPIDRRPLWMKLQEQKDKKQAEWEEKHDPKAMVQGLEEEEAEFLNKVADYQDRENTKLVMEEIKEMKKFREAAQQVGSVDHDALLREQVLQAAASQVKKKPTKSPASLLAGMVKTKRKRSLDSEPAAKTVRQSPDKPGGRSLSSDMAEATTPSAEKKEVCGGASSVSRGISKDAKSPTTPSAGLSGLAAYSDDSDSESD